MDSSSILGRGLIRAGVLVGACLACSGVLTSPQRADPAGELAPQSLAGCAVFPSNDIWNVPVDTLPVDSRSAAYITNIGSSATVHPDFGSQPWEGAPIGIPFVVVPGTQPKVTIYWTAYGDESDPGPYPVPSDAPIEGGSSSNGDRHVLVLDRDNCMLYELYRAFPHTGGGWDAESGAVYNLGSHALRPAGWTSADAAGLPMLPGLARYDEVAAGEITHALRFTVPRTRREYVWPARHFASSSTNPDYPPMGQRFRLKASFDVSGFAPQVQVILRALKKYGMILADNGSAWYISGAPDAGWDDDTLVTQLRQVHGTDFEAVDVSSLMIDPNSGEAKTGGGTGTKRLTAAVTGSGSIDSSPGGIACPGDCSQDYPDNTPVSVTATEASGWSFDHWLGACSGSTPTCDLVMSVDRSVTAVFTAIPGGDWVRVLKPNGGESWRVGNKRAIRWTSSGFGGGVKVELSTDSGASWKTIWSSTANDGYQQWKVTRSRSTHCRVRITSVADPSVSDTSDGDFAIR